MASWGIIESELIEWLKSYGGPRYHAVVSDPPYALISIAKRFGKAGSAPAQEGSDGRYSRLSKGFMASKWDSFASLEHYQGWVSEWSKLMIERLLYPGAVCLFFGGTRTFHHLGVGLENGGFEIVDSILIPWIHGQGFPKSHDISKGLDKAAGAEREVTGKAKGAASSDTESLGEFKLEYDETTSATSEAAEWEGYGTSLKPAWEPVFVCRAPRRGLTRTWTFAQLATEFGTGALNIDGSRIDLKGDRWEGNKENAHEEYSGQVFGKFEKQYAKPSNPSGRWPANFILSHTDECVKVGEFEVEGRTINRFEQGMMPFGGAEGEDYQSEQMPPETVERWACVQGCPVRMLDDQAGELESTFRPNRTIGQETESGTALFGDRKLGGTYSGTGGPSRFFYTAKASRSEKDKGLENFYWARTDEGFQRISLSEYEQLDKRERAHGCIHPTVKPLELLRYLSTLLLPPKQEGRIRRILIPFSGIGSEMIGACQVGWDEVLGIEMEPNYVMMAEAHIKATIGMF